MGGWTRVITGLLDGLVDPELRERHARLDLRVNEYGYDRWGASRDDTLRALALMRILHRKYFRTQATGLEHVPDQGRVLLVGNHSAQFGYDGMLVASTLFLDKEPPRIARAMIERFFVPTPILGTFMTRMGQITGVQENAERILTDEEGAVLVFPEGARGGGRVWADRYAVLGFSQGFLRLAKRTKTPIVPFAFIGGEEMLPSLSRVEPMARLLGVPYMPIVPWILPVPAPVSVHVHFGAPMFFEGTGDEEDDVVLPMVRQVEHAVSELIAQGLSERKGIFF